MGSTRVLRQQRSLAREQLPILGGSTHPSNLFLCLNAPAAEFSETQRSFHWKRRLCRFPLQLSVRPARNSARSVRNSPPRSRTPHSWASALIHQGLALTRKSRFQNRGSSSLWGWRCPKPLCPCPSPVQQGENTRRELIGCEHAASWPGMGGTSKGELLIAHRAALFLCGKS